MLTIPARLLRASPSLAAATILARLMLPRSARVVGVRDVQRIDVGRPPADLYLPSAGPSPGIVLVLGALREGRRYELLEQAARSLAGCGYAVLVPELGRLRRLVLGTDALEDLVDATLSMNTLPGVRAGPVGLFGFSLGGSIALLAAADPRLRVHVACVASMGGYYRLADMLVAATTGVVTAGARTGLEAPSVYAVCASLVALTPEPDRSMLEHALEASPEAPLAAVAALADKPMGAEARAVIALLGNRLPASGPALLGKVDGLEAAMAALSPESVIGDIQAPAYVLHDERDRYVPFSQSLLMREATAGRRNFHFFATRLLEHTEPAAPSASLPVLFADYLPGLLRLARFVRAPLAALRTSPRPM